MAIPFATTNIEGANFSTVWSAPTAGTYNSYDSTPPFPAGTIAGGADGTVWVYCKIGTGGVTGLGYAVVVDEDYLATMISTTNSAFGDRVGVAPAAALINDYAWIQLYGTCDAIQVSASTTANAALITTATAGQIVNGTTTGTKNLPGIILTTARGGSAGTAPGLLNWPTIGTTNP